MSIPYRANYSWRNHGKNLSSTVARYYEPASAAEVQQIVKEAQQYGRKVRVVGDSHSWSPLAVTGDYLISEAASGPASGPLAILERIVA